MKKFNVFLKTRKNQCIVQENQKYCKNCGQKLDNSFKYCPACGQNTEEDLTLKELFHNTISNYFSVDARFFKSFLPLMFKPGYLPLKFVEGKRMTYLHPTQFYLFVSVIFFFLLSFDVRKQEEKVDKTLKTGIENIERSDTSAIKVIELNKTDSIISRLNINLNMKSGALKKANTDSPVHTALQNAEKGNRVNNNKKELIEKLKEASSNEENPLWKRKLAKQIIKIYNKRGSGFLQVMYGTVPVAMFVLLPVFALLLKLLFFKSGKYSVHLVFGFYFFSFLFMAFSFYLIASFLFTVPSVVFKTVVLLSYIYFLIALVRFYRQPVLGCIFKSMAILGLYLLFIIPTSAGIIAIISLLIY